MDMERETIYAANKNLGRNNVNSLELLSSIIEYLKDKMVICIRLIESYFEIWSGGGGSSFNNSNHIIIDLVYTGDDSDCESDAAYDDAIIRRR